MRMAHSKEPFYWDNTLEKAWQVIKLIASLNMENTTIDPEKTLYLACDASQVACGYILFQIADDGNIIMCSTSTRVFIHASRNKSAAFRELLAIVTGVTDQEYVIRITHLTVSRCP